MVPARLEGAQRFRRRAAPLERTHVVTEDTEAGNSSASLRKTLALAPMPADERPRGVGAWAAETSLRISAKLGPRRANVKLVTLAEGCGWKSQ